jgi:hypothetical protein
MNAESPITSIYNPKRKGKDPLLLPKIAKQDTPPANKAFARTATRHPQHQNIFKLDRERIERGRGVMGRDRGQADEE